MEFGAKFEVMLNPMELTGKHILFVGGSTGIDKSVILRLKDLNAIISLYEEFDISIIEKDIKELIKKDGSFDGVIFAIVHSDFKPLNFVKPDNVCSIMNDNFGVFVEIIRALKKNRGLNDGASIVTLSSISSIRAMKAKMAFSASKAALDASVRCLAIELLDKGIRINSVQKGFVEEDFAKGHIQDINAINDGSINKSILGVTKADEIANLIAFLLSDATQTITGTSIVIDGGYTL
ncbi:MAG: SDR family oxidoreductase [Bacteroidaceae bacterium]|nr:SDR family oxidoreductase [Bacteroidaceae bacterium]